MATIYVLFHPQKDFTGLLGGIYFEAGRGSTSDEIDADNLVKKTGCKKMTLEEYEEQMEAEKKANAKKQKSEEKAPEAKTTKAEQTAKK